MKKNTDEFDDELEGLDLSVLSNSGGMSSTPGINLNLGDEIDSIEAINNKPSDKPADDDTAKTTPKDKEVVEEVEEEEEEEVEEVVEEEDSKKTDTSALRIFAEMQREKGLLDFEDEDYEDSEDFILNKVQEKIDKSIKEGIEEYKQSFTKEAQEVIEAMEAGIPLESLVEKNRSISQYEGLKDSDIENNEALQKALIRDLYTLKGYSKELIDKKIQRFEDTGIMDEEAKDARAELVEYAKIQKEEEKENAAKAKKAEAERFDTWKKSIKETLDKTDELIPGMKLTPKQKEIVNEGLTKFDKEGKNQFQKIMEKDPQFNLKIAYLALALNWDFSSFEKKAATSVSKKLKDALRDQDKMSGGYGGVSHVKSSADLSVIGKALKHSRE